MTFVTLVAPLRAPAVREHPKGVLPQIRKTGADVAILTEAYPQALRAELRQAHDYRYVVEDGGKDKVRGWYDTPLLVRTELRSFGSGQVFGAAAGQPRKFAPERGMTYAAQATEAGTVCVVGLHPHPRVQGPDGNFRRTALARQYQNQMRRLDALLDFAQAMKWQISAGGDVNFRDQGKGSDVLSPYAIFRDHGLKVESSGIVALAWTPRLNFDVTEVHAPKAITDHVWLKGAAR